jgi:hypothetical protein
MITRAAIAALTLQTAMACELPAGAERFESARYRLALSTEPDAIHPGKFFAVLVTACAKDEPASIETLRVNAHMPQHRHGMNYAPRIVALSPGRYRAEGFMFHMPGSWEFVVELRADGRNERATLSRRID